MSKVPGPIPDWVDQFIFAPCLVLYLHPNDMALLKFSKAVFVSEKVKDALKTFEINVSSLCNDISFKIRKRNRDK